MRRGWEFEHTRDVAGLSHRLGARNGSEVGRLHALDVVRHDDRWLDRWVATLIADWREREAS